MSLIAMAVYCTEENQKDACFEKSFESVMRTVDLRRHRFFLSVNGATEQTEANLQMLEAYVESKANIYNLTVLRNESNLGTAKAINLAWQQREPGEHCVKMDDDIVINHAGWVDELEDAIRRDPLIGQCGLKRKDCWEHPAHNEADFKSSISMLPHVPGERWQIVERVKHVIGSCVMHSSALLDKIGYLYQPSLYGYDDVIASHRSQIAGFYNCFLPYIDIDHIDEGKTPYQDWKHKHSGEQTQGVIDLVHAMIRGEKSIYYDL